MTAFSKNLLSCLQDLRFSQRCSWRLSFEMWRRADWWWINDENNYLSVDTASQPTELYALSAQTVLKMKAVSSSESWQTTTRLHGITYQNVLVNNSRILCPELCKGLTTKPHEASWQSFISSRNTPSFFNMQVRGDFWHSETCRRFEWGCFYLSGQPKTAGKIPSRCKS